MTFETDNSRSTNADGWLNPESRQKLLELLQHRARSFGPVPEGPPREEPKPDSFDPNSFAAAAYFGSRRRRRLLRLIHYHGGEITCRQLMRHGLGCGDKAEARALLDSLAIAGLGWWRHAKPGPRGGRPTEVFVLAPRLTKRGVPLKAAQLEEALKWAVLDSDYLRELSWDLAELIKEHLRLDPQISAAEIERVLAGFRRIVSTLLPPRHRPDKTPVRLPRSAVASASQG